VDDPGLPNGVLDFYSDGSLTCSTNVGGANTSATCEIVYTKYANVTTTVEYLSGTSSASQQATVGIWYTGPTTFTTTLTYFVGTAAPYSDSAWVLLVGSDSWPAPSNPYDVGTVDFTVNGEILGIGCAGPNSTDAPVSWGSDPAWVQPGNLDGGVCQYDGGFPASFVASYSGTTYTTPDLPPGDNTITIEPASGTGTVTNPG
jgi:hypothetical protein